jgi:hypothetical protein
MRTHAVAAIARLKQKCLILGPCLILLAVVSAVVPFVLGEVDSPLIDHETFSMLDRFVAVGAPALLCCGYGLIYLGTRRAITAFFAVLGVIAGVADTAVWLIMWNGPSGESVRAFVGLWLLILVIGPSILLISLATVALSFWESRKRYTEPGCCPKCGYNLTGLHQPRCPECGAPFSSSLLRSPSSVGRQNANAASLSKHTAKHG